MEGQDLTIIGLVLSAFALIIFFLRGAVTRFFQDYDDMKKENERNQTRMAALEAASAQRDQELAGIRAENADTLARLDRETKAKEQAEAAAKAANERADTAQLEKQQLDAQYKAAQSKLEERITALETGRQTDKDEFERRYAAREEEHKQELAERDKREARLTSERDSAVADRDGALSRVTELEHEVQGLKQQVADLTTELREMKAKASAASEKAKPDENPT